jgi:hypothetical protein
MSIGDKKHPPELNNHLGDVQGLTPKSDPGIEIDAERLLRSPKEDEAIRSIQQFFLRLKDDFNQSQPEPTLPKKRGWDLSS